MATQVTVMARPAKSLSSPLDESQTADWVPRALQSVSSQWDSHKNQRPVEDGEPNAHLNSAAQSFDISANSMQFVASPGQTNKLQAVLPGAIQEAFRFVPSFAGCMVMIADQEARRVTIVTFWNGKERARHRAENGERMRMLLFPYVDHWLRSENHVAHLAIPSGINILKKQASNFK
jgi:hypothetical protein